MVSEILSFTAKDGYECKYRHYPAQGDCKGMLVGIHGIQSHSGWYQHSCQRYADAGFTVFFLDRRGSGMNQLDRGDAPHFRRLLDDVAEFIDHVRQPDLPLFVLSISWGAKLGAALQRRRPGICNGVIFIAPGFFSQVRNNASSRFLITMSRVFFPRMNFLIPLNNPELFTSNPLWIQFLKDDESSLHVATGRLLFESFRLDIYLYFTPPTVNVPVLLLLAGKDRIINNEKCRGFFDRFASTDKTVIEYQNAHHTLEFEADPEPMIDDVIHWLQTHCQKQA